MDDNFSCFDENLSHHNITTEEWFFAPDSPQKASSQVTAIIILLFIILGLPWNIVVQMTLIKDKFYQEPSSFLLFNLTIVDLLTCLLVMPILAVPGLAGGKYILGTSDYQLCQTCYASVMLVISLLLVSLHILAVMSVDRLVYIIRPLTYHKTVTIPRTIVAVLFSWIVSVLLSLPPLFQFGEIGLSNYVGACSPLLTTHTRVGPSYYYIALLVLEILVPVNTLIISNVWLIITLCKSSRKRLRMSQVSFTKQTPNINRQAKSNYTKQQLNMVMMFGLIFLGNIISWAPIIISLLYLASQRGSNTSIAFSVIYISFLSQSVFHPILESCLITTVRKSLKKTLTSARNKIKNCQSRC